VDSIVIRDSYTGKCIEVPPGSVCAACGREHDPTTRKTTLVIDHDRFNWPYTTRVLCISCNARKGSRRYVGFKDGSCWIPGMHPGERIPNIFTKRVRAKLGKSTVRQIASSVRNRGIKVKLTGRRAA